MNNRIRSIIQSFLTPKDDYTHLKPIGIVNSGYGTQWGVGFKPMDGYKKEGYDIKDDLTDDSKRINILDKLNKDIRAYNKWSDGRLEYPDLDEYSPWSFLVVRADLEYVDKKLYVEIIDEELYKLKDDDADFVPRFNKSIYDYIKLQKHSAEEDGRWDEKNIWYQPFRNFGDWFDKNPSDARPYFEKASGKINWTKPLWELALKMRKRKDSGDYKSYMDAYRFAVKQYNSYGEPIPSPETVRKAFDNAKEQGRSKVIDYLESRGEIDSP